jgi:Glyoxalase-like domain
VVKHERMLVTAMRVEPYVAPTWPAGSVPKQAHIDVDVDDLASSDVRARSLGAVRASWQPDPETFLVFFDPAGHPFCLTTQIPNEWSAL